MSINSNKPLSKQLAFQLHSQAMPGNNFLQNHSPPRITKESLPNNNGAGVQGCGGAEAAIGSRGKQLSIINYQLLIINY
jgi:hypothetical protein